jgi:hypothetical protein
MDLLLAQKYPFVILKNIAYTSLLQSNRRETYVNELVQLWYNKYSEYINYQISLVGNHKQSSVPSIRTVSTPVTSKVYSYNNQPYSQINNQIISSFNNPTSTPTLQATSTPPSSQQYTQDPTELSSSQNKY